MQDSAVSCRALSQLNGPADVRASSAPRIHRASVTAALAGIYLVTLTLTLHRIDLPLLEFYPVRQVQTAEITRNLYRVDHNIFVPKRFSGPELRAFILEFPLYNAVVALGYAVSGGVHATLGRLVSVGSWLGAGLCLFALVRPYYGDRVALGSLFFFHMSRLGIQVSRSFQPDAMMVLLSLATLLAWDRWLRDKGSGVPVAAAICGVAALLVKLPIVHIALPLAYLTRFVSPRQRRWMAGCAIVAIGAAVVWHSHARAANMMETPEISGNWHLGNWFSVALVTSQSFYVSLYAIWRGKVFGTTVFMLAVYGALMRPPSPRHGVFHVWLISVIAYLLMFNRHAISHDYYNVPLVAVGAVFAARAFDAVPDLVRRLVIDSRLIQAGIVLVVVITTVGFLRGRAYAVPSSEVGVLDAAWALQRVTAPDSVVLVPGNVLAYHADRASWEVPPDADDAIERLERFRARGARVYATGDRAQFFRDAAFSGYLVGHYPVLSEGERFIIFDLTRPEVAVVSSQR